MTFHALIPYVALSLEAHVAMILFVIVSFHVSLISIVVYYDLCHLDLY